MLVIDGNALPLGFHLDSATRAEVRLASSRPYPPSMSLALMVAPSSDPSSWWPIAGIVAVGFAVPFGAGASACASLRAGHGALDVALVPARGTGGACGAPISHPADAAHARRGATAYRRDRTGDRTCHGSRYPRGTRRTRWTRWTGCTGCSTYPDGPTWARAGAPYLGLPRMLRGPLTHLFGFRDRPRLLSLSRCQAAAARRPPRCSRTLTRSRYDARRPLPRVHRRVQELLLGRRCPVMRRAWEVHKRSLRSLRG